MSDKIYDRESHPFKKLYRFFDDVEKNFQSKDGKDIFTRMLEELSPESKKPILPDKIDDEQ